MPVDLILTGSFVQVECITRNLRHNFHVTHHLDTSLGDNDQHGAIIRTLAIDLNGRPVDDGKLWLELVDTAKGSIKADYEYQIDYWRGQHAAAQNVIRDLLEQHTDFMAELQAIINKLEGKQ